MPLEEVGYVFASLTKLTSVLSHTFVKLFKMLLLNISRQEISFLKAKLKDAQEKLQIAETKIKVCFVVCE